MADDTKIVVLVADDEPSTLALLSRHLRGKGYTVLEASDGDQAWELAHQHLPHLVVLDVMMPGMSGWEVCRKIREAVSLAHTGVIMLTGIGERLNEMTSPLYGADAHIDKPFEFADLDDKIQSTLERRSSGTMGRPDGAQERNGSVAVQREPVPAKSAEEARAKPPVKAKPKAEPAPVEKKLAKKKAAQKPAPSATKSEARADNPAVRAKAESKRATKVEKLSAPEPAAAPQGKRKQAPAKAARKGTPPKAESNKEPATKTAKISRDKSKASATADMAPLAAKARRAKEQREVASLAALPPQKRGQVAKSAAVETSKGKAKKAQAPAAKPKTRAKKPFVKGEARKAQAKKDIATAIETRRAVKKAAKIAKGAAAEKPKQVKGKNKGPLPRALGKGGKAGKKQAPAGVKALASAKKKPKAAGKAGKKKGR